MARKSKAPVTKHVDLTSHLSEETDDLKLTMQSKSL